MAHVVDTTYGRNRDLGQVTDPALLDYYRSQGYTIDGTVNAPPPGAPAQTVLGLQVPYGATDGEVVTVKGGQFITAPATGGGGSGSLPAGSYVPEWQANTAYTAGQYVLNPSGQIVSANSNFTSGSSYNASNWTLVTTSSGGAGLPSNIVSKTTAYTAAAGDFVEADTSTAGFTVTLPTAPAAGTLVAVKKVSSDANTLTIAPTGGGSIDGDANATTVTPWAGAVFEHKASNVWRIAASMTTTGPAGPTGPQGVAGPTGSQGPAGTIGTVQNAGADMAQRSKLNFVGATLTDDSANNRTTVTISGGSGATASPGFVLGLASGRWSFVGDINYSGPLTITGAMLYAIPIVFPRPTVVTGLGVRVWTAGSTGSVTRLGLYNPSGDVPGTLLLDAGTVDTSSNGAKQITGLTQNVNAGLYFAVLAAQGAPTTQPQFLTLRNEGYFPGITLTTLTDNSPFGYGVAATTGALPGTWAALAQADAMPPRFYIQTNG